MEPRTLLDLAESHALAGLVAETGRPGFSAAMMAALHTLAAADMCSSFAISGDEPEILFAASVRPELSGFAQVATLRYATTYWKRDTATASMLGRAHHSVRTMRRPASVIRDLDYRHECYAEGGVVERISICRSGGVQIVANAYRDRSGGAFSQDQIERLERASPIVMAAIERHRALLGDSGRLPATGDALALAPHLLRAAPSLSVREAQVLARIAGGEDQNEIAAGLGVAVSSVVTYRRRGYAKLGVRGRGELRARVARLEESPASPA